MAGSDTAVFNFEGGCYAKMIRLSEEAEPEIYATTKKFGTVLENVVMDPVTRELDFDDNTLAENTRGAYPIELIPNTSDDNLGPVPSNVIMLTADAFAFCLRLLALHRIRRCITSCRAILQKLPVQKSA